MSPSSLTSPLTCSTWIQFGSLWWRALMALWTFSTTMAPSRNPLTTLGSASRFSRSLELPAKSSACICKPACEEAGSWSSNKDDAAADQRQKDRHWEELDCRWEGPLPRSQVSRADVIFRTWSLDFWYGIQCRQRSNIDRSHAPELVKASRWLTKGEGQTDCQRLQWLWCSDDWPGHIKPDNVKAESEHASVHGGEPWLERVDGGHFHRLSSRATSTAEALGQIALWMFEVAGRIRRLQDATVQALLRTAWRPQAMVPWGHSTPHWVEARASFARPLHLPDLRGLLSWSSSWEAWCWRGRPGWDDLHPCGWSSGSWLRNFGSLSTCDCHPQRSL